MAIPWLFLGVELLAVYPLHILMDDFPAAMIVVILNALTVELFLLKQQRSMSITLTVAFFLRLLAAIFDSITLNLSNMNSDCLGYFDAAKVFAEGHEATYGWMYSRLLGVAFRFAGSSRFLAEYINVILGLTTIWILYKSLILISIDKRKIYFAVWVISVFPYSIYSSCVTYRETIIATFVALSVYFALKWYLRQKWKNMFLCFASIAIASTFHAGVVVMSLGFALLFTMYSYQTNRFAVNKKSIISLGLFLSAFALVVLVFPEVFFAKLSNMSEESIVTQVNWNYGGSAYLSWLHPNSLLQVIIASPLKLLYFLFSPLPGDWRGIVDIVTFLIDGCVYLYCIYYTLKNYKESKYRHFIAAIFIGWIITALVFGLGTWTAGTAIRHRNKIFMVLLLITVMSSVRNDKERAQDKI